MGCRNSFMPKIVGLHCFKKPLKTPQNPGKTTLALAYDDRHRAAPPTDP
jgi:hypothetical protein